MPGPGPIGQPVAALKDLGSQGILARTFSVLPGPLGANRLQNQAAGCVAGRTAGAGDAGLASADQPLELASEP